MMISARRKKGRLSPITLRHLETEDVAVKSQRPLNVGNFEMHMPDPRLRVNWISLSRDHIRDAEGFSRIGQQGTSECRGLNTGVND